MASALASFTYVFLYLYFPMIGLSVTHTRHRTLVSIHPILLYCLLLWPHIQGLTARNKEGDKKIIVKYKLLLFGAIN